MEAINNASKEIKNLQEEQKFDPEVIAQIINKHLEQTGIIYSVEKKDLHLETGHKEEKINKKSTTNKGGESSSRSRKNLKV